MFSPDWFGGQFGSADILTLDRDFAIFRWGKNKPFRELPSADLRVPREQSSQRVAMLPQNR
jgi:hypothetical protein